MKFFRIVCGVSTTIILFLTTAYEPVSACLRPTLDDRAVQWSSLIVVAKLVEVGEKTAIAPPATQPSMDILPDLSEQKFTFEMTTLLDGKAAVGDHLTVIRFSVNGSDDGICGQNMSAARIGKSFLLFLRPHADLNWNGKDPDPRPADVLSSPAALAVVHLESMDDLGMEGLADAKYTIKTTRDAETQFNAEDARAQAQAVRSAADDTEEEQAEHALLEMGPKAADVIRDQISKADDVGKSRLSKVLDAILPPSMATAMKSH